MSDDFDMRMQRQAEAHLEACLEALYDEDARSPASAPFDGCPTCVVREVLTSVWDDMLAYARALDAQARAGGDGEPDALALGDVEGGVGAGDEVMGRLAVLPVGDARRPRHR
jgi:hypothetical protein